MEFEDAVSWLAKDFKRWGKERTRRVLRGVTRWGVIFHDYTSRSRKRG